MFSSFFALLLLNRRWRSRGCCCNFSSVCMSASYLLDARAKRRRRNDNNNEQCRSGKVFVLAMLDELLHTHRLDILKIPWSALASNDLSLRKQSQRRLTGAFERQSRCFCSDTADYCSGLQLAFLLAKYLLDFIDFVNLFPRIRRGRTAWR